MTAIREQTAKTPPRILVRTFWMLHRAAYRLTGGRFGLSRPEEGAKFGMLRLTTIGRRSGRSRVTMVGYYEDGPNLVTLAMNGWGHAEPAWWLNLQATPEVTVVLPDGPRRVRARAAAGEERERLWARFRDYPGWGEDLDGLAARRPRPTAVVVLEPIGSQARVAGERSVDPPVVADRAAATRAEATPERRRLRLRHLWIVPGLGIAVYASTQAERLGLGIAPLLAFTIAPDLTRLLGIGQPRASGQFAPRVVPLYNALHHPIPPLLILGLAVAGVLPALWFVGSLAWLGHLVIGLGIGDRMRSHDGYLRPFAIGGRASSRGPQDLTGQSTSAESPA